MRFDVSSWGLITANEGTDRIGSVVVAWRTHGLVMLESRDDLAVIWDLRVRPDARRRGVGAALIDAAELWAESRGSCCLKVETQNVNVNVPACRLYARCGFQLGGIHRFAYPEHPDETQLLWYRRIER